MQERCYGLLVQDARGNENLHVYTSILVLPERFSQEILVRNARDAEIARYLFNRSL